MYVYIDTQTATESSEKKLLKILLVTTIPYLTASPRTRNPAPASTDLRLKSQAELTSVLCATQILTSFLWGGVGSGGMGERENCVLDCHGNPQRHRCVFSCKSVCQIQNKEKKNKTKRSARLPLHVFGILGHSRLDLHSICVYFFRLSLTYHAAIALPIPHRRFSSPQIMLRCLPTAPMISEFSSSRRSK